MHAAVKARHCLLLNVGLKFVKCPQTINNRKLFTSTLLRTVHSRQLCCVQPPLLQQVKAEYTIPVRHYRQKRDLSHLSLEERYIFRVLEFEGRKDVTVENLKTYAQRLAYLVQKGCRSYELIEHPDVIDLNEFEIDIRITKLQSCGFTQVSIPLINYANPFRTDNQVCRQIVAYLKDINEGASKTAAVVDALGCSDLEMMEILTRNPRLVGTLRRKDMVEKIRCLLEHGANVNELKRNSNILNNKLLEVIRTRAEQLSRLGFNCPLPVGLISRDDKSYNAIVAVLEAEHANSSQKTITATDHILRQLPFITGINIVNHRPKIEFLLTTGYQPQEILAFPKILDVTLKSLKSSVDYLRRYYLGLVSLPICHHHALYGTILYKQASLRVLLRHILGIAVNDMPSIPEDLATRSFEEQALLLVRDCLHGAGFCDSDIANVPLILIHSIDIVKLHLNLIADESNDTAISILFRKYSNDRKRQLNLLLYSIERAVNFGNASLGGGPDCLPEADRADAVHERAIHASCVKADDLPSLELSEEVSSDDGDEYFITTNSILRVEAFYSFICNPEMISHNSRYPI